MPVPNDEIDFLRAERRAMADRTGKRKRDDAANAAGIQVVSVGDPRRVPIADLEMRFNSTPTPGLSAPIETTTQCLSATTAAASSTRRPRVAVPSGPNLAGKRPRTGGLGTSAGTSRSRPAAATGDPCLRAFRWAGDYLG